MEKLKYSLKNNFQKYTLVIEMIAIFVLFQFLTNGLFMTTRNLSNLMMQGTTCSLIAVTMMLVIVTCNADLSAGSAIGFIGTFAATLQVSQWNTGITFVAVIAVALVLGLWHGFWIAYIKLPAFIVTLATQLVLKGLNLFVGGGVSIGPVSQSFSHLGKTYLPGLFGAGAFNGLSLVLTIAGIVAYFSLNIVQEKKKIKLGLVTPDWNRKRLMMIGVAAIAFAIASIFIFYMGFPLAIIMLVVLVAIFEFVVKNTKFGRHVFAVGGNSEAARLSGVNIEKTVMCVYILHSLVVGLAAVIYLGRVGQASPTAGTSFEFTAITGCVVGGTSIMGGRGNVIGAVIGTMLMASLDNGMSLLNLGQASQFLVKGLVLMLAITMDVISLKKNG